MKKTQADIIRDKIKDVWPFPTGPKPNGAEMPTINGIYNGGLLTGGEMNPEYEPDYPEEFGAVEKDPNGKSLNEPGAKADSGKIRPWLMMSGFARALEELSKVTTEGAAKYTANGWITVPNAQERYLDAFGRHLLKYAKGEEYDNDVGGIGTHHLAQMAWNILAVLELRLRDTEGEASSAYVGQ